MIDFINKIGPFKVKKSDLLWQGKDNFYITKHTYFHSKKSENIRVASIDMHKPNKEFKLGYTVPVRRILELDNISLKQDDKDLINNFINYFIVDFESKDIITEESIDDTQNIVENIKELTIQEQEEILKIEKLHAQSKEIAMYGKSIIKVVEYRNPSIAYLFTDSYVITNNEVNSIPMSKELINSIFYSYRNDVSDYNELKYLNKHGNGMILDKISFQILTSQSHHNSIEAFIYFQNSWLGSSISIDLCDAVIKLTIQILDKLANNIEIEVSNGDYAKALAHITGIVKINNVFNDGIENHASPNSKELFYNICDNPYKTLISIEQKGSAICYEWLYNIPYFQDE